MLFIQFLPFKIFLFIPKLKQRIGKANKTAQQNLI